MKIETIKERIFNNETKLEKSLGTLERHKKQLEKKSALLIENGIDLNNYKENMYEHNTLEHSFYWELCDYEHKLEDIESTEKKIRIIEKDLEKYKTMLVEQTAKDESLNGIIPECLDIFLNNWKKKAFKFYINLANKYIELKFKEYEIEIKHLKELKEKIYIKALREYEELPKYSAKEIEKMINGKIEEYEKENIKNSIRYQYLNNFKKSLFASDLVVIEKIIDYNVINDDILNKILDNEVKEKRESFINRLKEVIGDIKDLSGLYIAGNGEINGIAIGIKCNAKVETITAGGYNVQIAHFRVLVNSIKM